MGLFSGGRQIPVTSYGYQPPQGATAKGYICLDSETCSNVVFEPVRRWPKACDKCGSPTDPKFNEPCNHESEGVYFSYMAEHGSNRPFFEDQFVGWQYKDALMRKDLVSAATAKAAGRERMTRQLASNVWYPPPLCWSFIWDGLVHGRLDDAAEELQFWQSFLDTTDLKQNNKNRTNIRQFLSASVRFLEHPAAAEHPYTPTLTAKLGPLAGEAREVMLSDTGASLRQMGILR